MSPDYFLYVIRQGQSGYFKILLYLYTKTPEGGIHCWTPTIHLEENYYKKFKLMALGK